jgi:hypothetical protein
MNSQPFPKLHVVGYDTGEAAIAEVESGSIILDLPGELPQAYAEEIVRRCNVFEAMLEGIKHGAASYHHPLCKNYGQDERCTCHVAKCRAALDEVRNYI